jgi:2-methylcitrate dehydratase PrpD
MKRSDSNIAMAPVHGGRVAEGPTARLARQAAELRFEDLPDDVVLAAKQCFLDTVGVAIAASSEPVTAIVRAVSEVDADPQVSSLLDGSGRRVSAAHAALINATAAHALDLDDMHPPMAGHPSASLVPATLALSEELGLGGPAMITAFVAGFETEFRVGCAVMPSHYRRGFHPTGTVGTIGTATAAGKVLGLSAERLEQAIGIAASEAAGLKIAFGTMTKPLQAGRAANNGLFAARLAAAGLSSARGAIEGPQGFAAAQADGLDLDVLTLPFDDRWSILDTVFKQHAACGYTHSAIDALLGIRNRLSLSEIHRIQLTVNAEALVAAGITKPTTALEAKFSLWFVAALALVTGDVGPRQFTAEMIEDPAVFEMAARIEVLTSTAVPRLGCITRVTDLRGQTIVDSRDGAQTSWRSDPAQRADVLERKFVGLVEPILGSTSAGLLHHRLMALEKIPDVTTILDGVRP